MKLPPILTGIVLDPVAGTLDFSALGVGFDPRTVLGVLHEPSNRFIFAKGRPGLGYVSIAGAVMTLAVDVSDLIAGSLTGFLDDGALIATDARLEACRALLATGNATLSNLSTALGTPADVAPGTDAAAGSLIAKVTRLLGTQTGIATVLAAIRDRLPAALVGGRLSVDGSGVTQPISAAALPLPAGAAQDGTLTARLGTLGQKTMAGSAPVVIASDQVAVPIQGGNATAVKTDGSATTQPVSAASLPLPAGAATSALQTTGNTALGAPADAAYTGAGSPSIIAALKGLYAAMIAATPAGANIIGKVGLDQTTPGTTNGVVVNSSALPTGAATDATLSARLGTLGQKAAAGSAPVVLASDQPAVGVTNAALVAPDAVPAASPIAFAQSGSVQVSAAVDLTGYNYVDVTAGTLIAGGSVNVQYLDSTGAWQPGVPIYPIQDKTTGLATAQVPITSITVPGFYRIPKLGKQLRFVQQVGTSGSTSLGLVLGSMPWQPQSYAAQAATSAPGGLTNVSRIASAAATTNATLAKAGAGRVYKITGFNAAASVRWLHFYDTASVPTPGTTPVKFALPMAPGAFSLDAHDIGYSFGTGIAFGLTTGAADNDATALTAGDILNLNVWVQ